MSSYARPAIAAQTYRDADGAVVEYGARWRGRQPPEESYSRDSHPERFAAVHEIADALIDYLRQTYDVTVTDDLSCVPDLRRPVDSLRAVRLTPARADAASLTFAFTDYPGVIVHAGLLQDFVYPQCGCDACDETWESVAEAMEWSVQAVVSGGYREDVRGDVDDPWIYYRLTAADGSRSGSGRADATAESGAELRAAAKRLDAMPDGWAAWPPARS